MKNALIIGAAIALSTAGISCSAENNRPQSNQPQKKTAPTAPVNHSPRENCNRIAANLYEKVCHQLDKSPEKIAYLRDTAVEQILTTKEMIVLTTDDGLIELPTYSSDGRFTPHKLPDGRILLLDIRSDGFGSSFILDDNPESKLIEVDSTEALRLCMASKIASLAGTKHSQHNEKR